MAVFRMQPQQNQSIPKPGGMSSEPKGYGSYTKPQPTQRPSIPAQPAGVPGNPYQNLYRQKSASPWNNQSAGPSNGGYGGVTAPAPPPIGHPQPLPGGGGITAPAPPPIGHPMPLPGGMQDQNPGGVTAPAPPPIPNPMPFPQGVQPVGQRMSMSAQPSGGALAEALARRQGNMGGPQSQPNDNLSILMQMLR